MREYRRLTERLIKPDIGSLRLGRVTTKRLDDYYAMLSKERGLSPATIRHVHAVFRGAFGQAVKWGIVPTNPAAAASPPKLRQREINPPAIVDVKRMLELADEDDPEYGALLRVLTATGALRGEGCSLVRPRSQHPHTVDHTLDRLGRRRHRGEGHQDARVTSNRTRRRDRRGARRTAPAKATSCSTFRMHVAARSGQSACRRQHRRSARRPDLGGEDLLDPIGQRSPRDARHVVMKLKW